jgi:hypothetical protein
MDEMWNQVADYESHHWNRIADYASEHRSCVHYCLRGTKPGSQLSSEDDTECSFNGLGIFCHAFNELASDLDSNESEYYKEIVKIKKHKHCVCHHAHNDDCPVHDLDTSENSDNGDESDFEEESISDDNKEDAVEVELGSAGVLKDLLVDDDIVVGCDGEWGVEFTKDELKEIERIEKEFISL